LTQPPLILASTSPRRAELLRGAGIAFKSASSLIEECHDVSLGLASLVVGNARAKALAVAASFPKSVIVGADTLVWLDGQPLGKPRNLEEARAILFALSGRTHQVATGVHFVRLNPRHQVEFHEVSYVRFRQLDEATITAYLSQVNTLDKAGAYALQESGNLIIESVEGSRSNVIGLPMQRTLAALQHFKS